MTIVPGVTTARLHGGRLSLDDLDTLCALHRDPEVMATLGGVRSDEQTRHYVAENLAHWDRHGYGLWIFRDRATGAFVGRGGLRHVTLEDTPEIEVTYSLARASWGKGFATEIATASLDVGVQQLGLTNIVAFALPENGASRRVMEKVGFAYERGVEHAGVPHVLYRLKRPASHEASPPSLAPLTVPGSGAGGCGQLLVERDEIGIQPPRQAEVGRIVDRQVFAFGEPENFPGRHGGFRDPHPGERPQRPQ